MKTLGQFNYPEVAKVSRKLGVFTPTEEEEHKWLYRKAFHIARTIPDATLYEYGTLCGSTAIAMGMAIENAKDRGMRHNRQTEAHLITVDNYASYHAGNNPDYISVDEVRKLMCGAEIQESVTVLEMDDLEHIATIEDRSANAIWLDSLHTYRHVSKQLDLALPKMAEHGFLCGHDYILDARGVVYAVEDFRKKYSQHICGFGVWYSNWWCLIRYPVGE